MRSKPVRIFLAISAVVIGLGLLGFVAFVGSREGSTSEPIATSTLASSASVALQSGSLDPSAPWPDTDAQAALEYFTQGGTGFVTAFSAEQAVEPTLLITVVPLAVQELAHAPYEGNGTWAVNRGLDGAAFYFCNPTDVVMDGWVVDKAIRDQLLAQGRPDGSGLPPNWCGLVLAATMRPPAFQAQQVLPTATTETSVATAVGFPTAAATTIATFNSFGVNGVAVTVADTCNIRVNAGSSDVLSAFPRQIMVNSVSYSDVAINGDASGTIYRWYPVHAQSNAGLTGFVAHSCVGLTGPAARSEVSQATTESVSTTVSVTGCPTWEASCVRALFELPSDVTMELCPGETTCWKVNYPDFREFPLNNKSGCPQNAQAVGSSDYYVPAGFNGNINGGSLRPCA